MAKSVIGVFNNRDQAERAVNELRQRGFTTNEISIVAKEEERREGGGNTTNDLTTGTTTGGILGGLAGLALGAGALAIPGIGPIVAAGPIAAAITGAATGGLAGALIDFGIPAERGEYYQEKIRHGKILAVIKCDDNKVNDAANILRTNGAQDVESHDVGAARGGNVPPRGMNF